jgi:hypothetical protein
MISSAFVVPDNTDSIYFCVLKIFLKKIKKFIFFLQINILWCF